MYSSVTAYAWAGIESTSPFGETLLLRIQEINQILCFRFLKSHVKWIILDMFIVDQTAWIAINTVLYCFRWYLHPPITEVT